MVINGVQLLHVQFTTGWSMYNLYNSQALHVPAVDVRTDSATEEPFEEGGVLHGSHTMTR